ncbi:MAG: hypothetical protein H5U07_08005, partial [Candidatus Aminicenantes bacterium]|nr:hypothetical protein [Candidatus Aminicenantes bacterium]
MNKRKKDNLILILAGVLVFFLIIQSTSLLADGKMPGGERTVRFARGLNLAFWFWLNKGEIVSLEKRISLSELKKLRNMGITFLRVPVDMANIYDPERADRLNPEKLALLFDGLKKIISCGLAVNFDLHSISQLESGSDYSGPLGRDEKFTEEFYFFWE